MNAPPVPRPGLDTFHRERSKCIDHFANLEEAVIELLDRNGSKAGSETLAQKLELLRKVQPNPKLSKQRVAALQSLIVRCLALNELRNDIVHSRLQVAIIGDDNRACFTNTRQCLAGSKTARLFSLQGLRDLSAELAILADELRKA